MEEKQKVAIFVIIALILAIIAISLNFRSSEVLVTKNSPSENSANVGVEIAPPVIEDKKNQLPDAGENS